MSRRLIINAFGEDKYANEWLKDHRSCTELTQKQLRARIRYGWSSEKAISQPVIKYQHNDYYFDKWTHENAWIIGFLTADGNISNNTLRIDLSIKDIEILKHIKDTVSPRNTIYCYERIKNEHRKSYSFCQLQITSPQIVKDLLKYNITSKKTGKEKLPDFPNKEIAYRYLLGLIDGDGSVCCNERNDKPNVYRRNLSLCSANKDFLQDIVEYFSLGVDVHKYGKTINCYRFSIEKKQAIIDIFHKLYNSNGFCLQRKKDKFIKIMRSYGEIV